MSARQSDRGVWGSGGGAGDAGGARADADAGDAASPAAAAALEIDELRREIDLVDDVIVGALDARAALVERIAEIKRAAGLPARDEARERVVLARLAAREGARLPEASLTRVFGAIMAACLSLHGEVER